MSMLNNLVGYWAYIWVTYIWGAYIRVRLYSGGGAYIWNDVSVSICGGAYIRGGLIFGGGAYIRGGACSRRFTVIEIRLNYGLVCCY